jgi:maleylpyruvate isomerase
MDAALTALSDQLDDATQRLLGTARGLSDSDLSEPSLLPGWTRAFVLGHLARNADALRNLLVGARAGESRSAYADAAEREAGIAASAQQDAQHLVADVADSSMAFRTVARHMPDPAWAFEVQILGSDPFPASQVLTKRLVEVELHHVDLGSGYGPADWPAAFTALDLPAPMRALRQDRLGS